VSAISVGKNTGNYIEYFLTFGLYLKMSCVYCCYLTCVYCCSCLVCIVVILCVFVVLCVYCCF